MPPRTRHRCRHCATGCVLLTGAIIGVVQAVDTSARGAGGRVHHGGGRIATQSPEDGPLRVLWVEQRHGDLEYYDALRVALTQRARVNITRELTPSRDPAWLSSEILSPLSPPDCVLLGFGWMSGEPPVARSIRPIPEFAHDCNATQAHHARGRAVRCFCGAVPLLVLLNKEYTLMPQKLNWLRAHCVTAAFSVHHDLASYENASAVPFHRIALGVDADRFSGATAHQRVVRPPLAEWPAYQFELGFTGVIRSIQTENWRYKVWKQACLAEALASPHGVCACRSRVALQIRSRSSRRGRV